VLAAIEAAFKALSDAGATVIDLDKAGFAFAPANGEFGVLLYDFKNDVAKYFATRVGVPVAGGTLADAIAFNNAHADVEMPYFNQDIWDLSNSINSTDPTAPQDPGLFCNAPAGTPCSYNAALDLDQAAGVSMDNAISMFNLDAVVSATDNPAWATDLIFGDHFVFGTSGLAGGPGYPILQVPAGEVFGAPFGISFFGSAFSEPKLIKLASGYEAFTHARAHNLPTFAATVPFDHIKGPLQQSSEADAGASTGQTASAAQASAARASAAGPAAGASTSNEDVAAKARKRLHHL
jgi:amidase